MDRKAVSFLIVGLAAGLLGSTFWFAKALRGQVAGEGAAVKVLKLAHGLDQSHPVHLGMERMAQRLEEISAGSMKIEIYANGVLGNETDCVEQLQHGALAMTKVSTAVLEAFSEEMKVFSLPYLFRDEAHFWSVLDSPVGRELLEVRGAEDLRGLCYYDSGSRNFYTVGKAVLRPGDLKGMKIRVMNSATAMAMMKQFEAAPTPIPWGELYTALQQGTVDGAENNPPSFTTNKHYEVCKHFSVNEHTRIPDILLISTVVWDSLTEGQQWMLQKAANDSVGYQRELWTKMTQESLEQAKERGVAIYYPDQRPFQEMAAGMYEGYSQGRVGELIGAIRAVETSAEEAGRLAKQKEAQQGGQKEGRQ